MHTLPPITMDSECPAERSNCRNPVFALEIDGRLKTEFSTKEGAEHGAIELKRRFPMLQIRIYDAGTRSRHDLPG
jgi:hypothetical protein